MISKKMQPMVENSSVIRQLFEEGRRLAAIHGEEKVFDFSLGNPNVPAPKELNEAIIDVVQNTDPIKLHGYMPNSGFPETRRTIAESLNKRFGTNFNEGNIIMTVGAAAAINVALKTMLDPGDEVICLAPYFFEYGSYISNYDGKLVVISSNPEGGFMPRFDELEEKITPRTKAIIINSPNNPTGAIYPAEVIEELSALLERKQKEFGTVIYLIADEPYRELVYQDEEVPYLTKFYANTLVAYSYSKSMSLPGERIGYLVIPDESDGAAEFFNAAVINNRIMGFVNAPAIMQLAIERCVDVKCEVEYYERNGRTLYDELTKMGFTCVEPKGAFYLWMQSPVPDEKEFVNKAKEFNILLVPGSSFAGPGYVRLSYCVSYEQIQRSLPSFKELAAHYFG